ncbi:hypothetical protein [Prevotella nigrescens]|uniref:hypothetical protein n=1 Tax=Prevotella nigrescens TaxID=28133 RepID=UPI0028EE94F5|nr:hypothetical protein [Prevotella nigrescens]
MSGNRPFRTTAKIATELRHLSLRGYDDCRFGVTTVVASGLRRLSLRGYDGCRFGVTTIAASGLRQTPLRNIGKHGVLLPCGTEVLKATNLPCVPWKETQGRFGLQVAVLCS